MARWLPELREMAKSDKNLLAGRISALFDLRLHQWVRIDVLRQAQANCKVHARSMIQALQAGTLLLFDRGYFSFEWFDDLTAQGLFWITRYANQASYVIVHECYRGDGVLDAIVQLGQHRADQAAQPVRLVQFCWHQQQYRYLTNVCDPLVLPVADIARLYARRWDSELAFRLLKSHLGLRLLWSSKWQVIHVHLWACLLLAQIFHGMQQEIARKAGGEPFDVSMDLLVRLTPRLLAQGRDPVEYLVRFGRDLFVIRPSTCIQIQTPVIDPSWVVPPPADVAAARRQARHAHRKGGPRPKPT